MRKLSDTKNGAAVVNGIEFAIDHIKRAADAGYYQTTFILPDAVGRTVIERFKRAGYFSNGIPYERGQTSILISWA